MKTIIHLFILCVISQICYSQNLITDENTVLKRGIYKTFDEFKTNTPSLDLSYEIKGYVNALESPYHDSIYNLKIEKNKTKEIGLVWGFCDGKNVYVNMSRDYFSGKKVFKPGSDFYKLLLVDRYCYFIYVDIDHGCQQAPYVIDFNDDNEMCLNCSLVHHYFDDILSLDRDLWNEYKNDKSKSDLYLKYLTLFSKKHKEDIKTKK